MGRYGVTANAIAPGALTRLTEDLGLPEEMMSRFGPEWVAPVVVWLASADSKDVNGEVIESSGMVLGIAEGWRRGPNTDNPPQDPMEVAALVRGFIAQATPRTTMADIS